MLNNMAFRNAVRRRDSCFGPAEGRERTAECVTRRGRADRRRKPLSLNPGFPEFEHSDHVGPHALFGPNHPKFERFDQVGSQNSSFSK